MSSALEELLVVLDEVDGRLRALYRSLSEDPGLASDSEQELRELHARRRELAEAVGLAVLAQRRAAPGIEVREPVPSQSDVAAAPSVIEPVVPEPPISAEALDAWMRNARVNGVGNVAYVDRTVTTWESTLESLMARLGAPRDLDLELDDELDALDRIGREPFIGKWSALPPAVQQTWLGMLVARTRAAKETEGISAADRARVKAIISRYPPWAFEHRPGHVHGLKVDHEPAHGSWLDDAHHLWAALDAELAHDSTPRRETSKKRRKVVDEEPSVDSVRPIDVDWALWPLVRGKSVVMVGGDPREPNRERLEKTFELRSLEWPDIAGPRKVDAVVSRIRRGTVDIVVLLKGFVDHKQSEPIIAAAKDSKVAWAMAESYGAASIKAGLKRFLPRSA